MNNNRLFLSLTDAEQEQTLTEVLVKAHRNAGKSVDGRNFPETIATLKDIIRKYYPKIKYTTVLSVFERGSLGMLGDYYGLNPRTFNTWLNAGYREEHHVRDSDIEEPTRPSTEGDTLELLDFLSEYIVSNPDVAYDGEKEYNYLRCKDVIPFGSDDGFLEKAERKFRNDAYKERRGERVRVVGEAVRLNKTDSDLKALAKRMAVDDWLLSLREQGKKPSNVITSRMSLTAWKDNGFHLPSVQYRVFLHEAGYR